MKMVRTLIYLVVGLFLVALPLYIFLLAPPQPKNLQSSIFTILPTQDKSSILNRLAQEGYIKNVTTAKLLVQYFPVTFSPKPGGFNLTKNLSLWQVFTRLAAPPDYLWVTLPEGLRKEQMGELLAEKLGWSASAVETWNTIATRPRFDQLEGVYFPDTYLISATATPTEVAAKLLARFNEVFTPYFPQFMEQNILWTTGLKIASLIQRETANPADMPIISGVIWNRLERGMKLEIDATLQYAKGKVGDRWWSTVVPQDKFIDSPYNTYQNKGLPPTPICNPGLQAIQAALHPAATDCIFYLHDKNGVMHCSVTYAEHLQNIKTYLQ